jgi:Ca2+-binding RTX toxin-like protein
VTLKNGDLSYTAPPSGKSDAFTYTVSDQLHETATGSVNVSLLGKNGPVALTGSDNIIVAGDGKYSVTGGTGSNFISLGGGNDSVSLPGNNNRVVLGDGNDSVSLSGNNNTAALGNGSDRVLVLGNNNAVTLGNGNDSVSITGTGNSLTLGSGHDSITSGVGSGGNSFTLDGSFASLMLQGSNNSVLVNGGSTSIWDTVGGTDALDLQIGPLGGSVGITDFSAANGVLALVSAMASTLGWTTPGQIDAAVTSDHHGGSLLSLGSQGSVDFVGVAPASLHATNFKIV